MAGKSVPPLPTPSPASPLHRMPRLQEITSLFATLATNLQTPGTPATTEVDRSISNLVRSLNLTESPRTPVLDAALSLMGFTAPEVYDSMVEHTLRTIIAVLRSSIECKVLRIDKEQVLRVGGSIWESDCASLMQWCAEILLKLDGHKGDLCALLLSAVIRLAAFAPNSQHGIPSISELNMKFLDDRASALASLLHWANKLNIKDGEVPLRFLQWHLNPMLLKQDVSQILQEAIERPLLSLSTETYERMEWRSRIIFLVMSPSIFVETRALLHNWFLSTGLASVMELQTVLVAQVLDVISRPMWWGISMEVGTKLPFSHAYFPYDHNSLRILAGPLTKEYFLQLLNKLNLSVSLTEGNVHTISKKSATKITMVDHKSPWSMAMTFPVWLCFASVLLFCNKSSVDTSYPVSTKFHELHDVEAHCSLGAARYISWLLNPISKSSQDILFDYLGKISELWIHKYFNSNKSKETRKPKLHDEEGKISDELDTQTIWLFLKEINDMYVKYFGMKVGFPISDANKGLSLHQSLLLRRIPLGILIGHPNHLDAGGCALLLHYAAIGLIQKLPESKNMGLQRLKPGRQWDWAKWVEEYTRAEAVAGCRIVFDTIDVIETISPSLFETEEEGLEFICQVKLKTGDYLLKCVKRLLQLRMDGDGLQMRKDLLNRIIRWRNQGKDVFPDNKDLDNVFDSLSMQQLP